MYLMMMAAQIGFAVAYLVEKPDECDTPYEKHVPFAACDEQALIVCMRFSAWSKTIDASGLEDVLGHLEAVHAVGSEQLLALRGLAIVERGRQCMNFASGFPSPPSAPR
jgi:hypothetical protein